jgi:hypothetical protein
MSAIGILPMIFRTTIRSLGSSRVEKNQRRQQLLPRRYDFGWDTPPGARASGGFRLRQPVRPHRQARFVSRQAHPDDGSGAAFHLGSDLVALGHSQISCPRRARREDICSHDRQGAFGAACTSLRPRSFNRTRTSPPAVASMGDPLRSREAPALFPAQ